MEARAAPPSWRRFGVVVLLCLGVSTQLLFQPAVLDGEWEPAEVFHAWLQFTGDILITGSAMWIGMICVERWGPVSRARHAALAAALLVAALAGHALAEWLLEDEGFRPPPTEIAGDAVRWAIFGGVVAFAVIHERRSREAAMREETANIERAALARRADEAHLQILQARIEPHFLFNTLAHVKRLYGVAPASGGEMLSSLHAYLRSALPRMHDANPTLGGEVELVEAYLRVLRLRMGTRLAFALDVPAPLRERAFPSMMLITLAENAIKHGVQPLPEGGKIEIAARCGAGVLEVEVRDTGAGFSANSGSGMGLSNIRERLRAMYADRASLVLTHNRPRGFTARICIPSEGL
jgi:hypothetical protein